MFLYSLISAHISCYYSNNKCEELLPYPVKKYLNRKISYFFSFIPKKHYTFALAIEAIHLFNLFRLQNGNHHWRDGRVVDYNGLENRRTERYRGFESLSLRKQGCKSASYAIYTLYCTQKVSRYFFVWFIAARCQGFYSYVSFRVTRIRLSSTTTLLFLVVTKPPTHE